MENLVEKSTLRAMMLEILLKDKELAKDIFDALVKENPQFVDKNETTYANEPVLSYAAESAAAYVTSEKGRHAKEAALMSVLAAQIEENDHQVTEKTEISDAEIRILAHRQFKKYAAVFKALA